MGRGRAIMVEFPGLDGENTAAGYDVENSAGGLVPSGVKNPFRSSERITNCVIALFANKQS